jgi:hypothetical protein
MYYFISLLIFGFLQIYYPYIYKYYYNKNIEISNLKNDTHKYIDYLDILYIYEQNLIELNDNNHPSIKFILYNNVNIAQ